MPPGLKIVKTNYLAAVFLKVNSFFRPALPTAAIFAISQTPNRSFCIGPEGISSGWKHV
jgi:hypothetical protein